MAIDAKAFGPALVKSGPSLTAQATRFVSDPSSSRLTQLFQSPSSFNASDAATLGSLGLSLAGGLIDDPAASAGLQTAGYAASAAANPFMAAWNLPQFANSISNLVDPQGMANPVTAKRRIERTRDAFQMKRDMLTPFAGGGSLRDIFASPVGDSNVGEGLASILRDNLSGGWSPGAGNSYNWRPDPALDPLRDLLQQMGYTGAHGPTRNNVGGVGEMVLGAGSPFYGSMRGLPSDPGEAQKEMLRRSGQDPTGQWQYVDTNEYTHGPMGWDAFLRSLTSSITGQPITAPSPWDVAPAAASGRAVAPGSTADISTMPDAMRQQAEGERAYDDYTAAVSAMDPAAANLMQTFDQQDEERRAAYARAHQDALG